MSPHPQTFSLPILSHRWRIVVATAARKLTFGLSTRPVDLDDMELTRGGVQSLRQLQIT